MTRSLNSAASTSQRSPRKHVRVALTAIAALALTSVAAVPATHAATPANAANQWRATVETFDTGVRNGYQLAFDSANRKVYFSDAKWRSETRTIVRDEEGNAYGYGGNIVITSASQGAPTSADRVFKFDDGTPIFEVRVVSQSTPRPTRPS